MNRYVEDLHRNAAVLEPVQSERDPSAGDGFLFENELLPAKKLGQGKRLFGRWLGKE